MRRRDFVTSMALGSAAGAVLTRSGSLAWPATPAADAEKLRRVCVSTWSFHNYFASTREPEFKLPGEMLKLVNFPKLMAEKYKVHHIEICVPHFESAEAGYLNEIKA